ncbi:MAG: sigma factor-like helix-turn-helix DNA-binding protein [Pirellulales bacterium]
MGRRTPATRRKDRSGPPPWEDLKDWFVRLMFLPHSDWKHTWYLLLSHPWFQNELDHLSSHYVWKRNRAVASAEDLRQEVIKLLGEKLSRNASLGLKIHQADLQFGAWMGAVLQRLCRQARRRLSKKRPAPRKEQPSQRAVRASAALDQRAIDKDLELKDALAKLNYGRRTVILFRALGSSYSTIAEVLHTHVSEVKSAEVEGHRELRKHLG